MELSSVSPPAASPTEGADLCETDVTDMAIHSVALLICLCGLAGNGAVLWLIVMNDITEFIFDLAVADFFFLLVAVPSALLFLQEDVSCSPIMPHGYLSFLFQLSMVSCYWTLFRLTSFSNTLDMDKLCWLFCHYDLPLCLMLVVYSVQYLAFFALFTLIPTVTFLCSSHEQEHCRAGFTSVFAITLLLFAAPVLISRSINFIKAKCGSQQQQPTRRDIIIFLIELFTLLLSLWNILQQFGYTGVSSQVFFLLTCIQSTIKPFIYFLAGRLEPLLGWRPCSMRSLRESLRRVFEERKENTPSSKDAAMDLVI